MPLRYIYAKSKEEDMLEPCPFCASARVEVEEVDADAWMVECLHCHATGPVGKSATHAEDRWNDRQLYPGTGREVRRYG